MKARACFWGGVILWLGCFWGTAWGIDPAAGVNSAEVIEFPTALNQILDHTFHATVEIVDIGDPDLRLENLRYGMQLGDFQLLADAHFITHPDREFNYGELRAKLRVLPLDEIRTNIAVGALGRYADDDAGKARIQNRSASLFTAITNQAYLFGTQGLLTSLYLDNLIFSFGFKLEIYQFILLAGEADYLHSFTDAPERTFSKLGIEIEGEQNFYFQLFYSNAADDFLIQIGSGF